MQYMLREQNIGKSASRFGFVVGIHAILGAALIAGLNRVPAVVKERPPILLINPERKLESQSTPSRELVRATLTSARPVIIPPIDLSIENTSVVDAALPTQSTSLDFADPSSSTSTSATSLATSSATMLGIACPNAALVQGNMRYPTQAIRDGIEGDVTARFVVGASGEIKNITILNSSSRIFNNVVTQAVQQFGCRGQGQDVMVEAPFTFRLK